MSSDPIADMLTIIRNGGAAKKKMVKAPLSQVKLEILAVLKENQFVEDFKVEGRDIEINLKYFGKRFAIENIKRTSKPGVRIYSKSKRLDKVLSGHGIKIVSTPKGVMNDNQARAKRLGGEVICEIY